MLNETAVGILRKLAKKSKIGEYNPADVVEALNLVDPGWSIEKVVHASSLHSSNLSDVGKAMLSAIVGENAFVNGGLTKDDSFDVSVEGPSGRLSDPKDLEPIAEKVRAALNIFGKKKPVEAVEGVLYAAKVEIESAHFMSDHHYVKVYGLTLGVPAWKVTAPDGGSVVLPVPPKVRWRETTAVPGNMHVLTSPTLWTWFYKGYGDKVAAKADDAANSPEAKADQARKAVLQMVSEHPGHFGTCPVCEHVHKLFPEIRVEGHPTMVHHGYERPGDGYIVGDCFAVKYPPYELSPLGCQKFADYLVGRIENAKQALEVAKAATSFYAHFSRHEKYGRAETYAPLRLHLDGRIEEAVGRTFTAKEAAAISTFDGRHLDPKATAADVTKLVQSTLNARISAAEHLLQHLVNLRERMLKKVANWKLAPLPGMSEADQADIAKMSGYCSGSGKYVGHRLSMPCPDCGARFRPTGNGKMRKHMAVKKAG